MNLNRNLISLNTNLKLGFYKKTLKYFILIKFKIKLEVGPDLNSHEETKKKFSINNYSFIYRIGSFFVFFYQSFYHF